MERAEFSAGPKLAVAGAVVAVPATCCRCAVDLRQRLAGARRLFKQIVCSSIISLLVGVDSPRRLSPAQTIARQAKIKSANNATSSASERPPQNADLGRSSFRLTKWRPPLAELTCQSSASSRALLISRRRLRALFPHRQTQSSVNHTSESQTTTTCCAAALDKLERLGSGSAANSGPANPPVKCSGTIGSDKIT